MLESVRKSMARSTSPELRVTYICGATALLELGGLRFLLTRFSVKTAVLFMGAAVVPQVGPAHLTMTAEEGALATRVFGDATIVPLHSEGWEHFTESRREIQRTFAKAGLEKRLVWLRPGVSQTIRTSQ